MGKKRKSGGRAGGGRGRASLVSCSKCGALVPRDKAIRSTKPVSLVESSLARELRKIGTIMPRIYTMRSLCVSCAVHSGVVKVRARSERRGPIK